MKFFTVIVSALSTLAAAAPAVTSTTTTDVAKRSTGEVVDKRAITFDLGLVNNFSGFQQVNLNYLLNINALQLNLLRSFAEINNFNVLQFQGLFQHQVFDLNSLLQLQALHTFLQIGQLGVLNGFDLAGLQLHFLNLGLLNNIGVIDLSQFIIPSVVGQVTSVARQMPVNFLDLLIPTATSAPSSSTTSSAVVVVDQPTATSNVVTAEEQEAQEGGSSLN